MIERETTQDVNYYYHYSAYIFIAISFCHNIRTVVLFKQSENLGLFLLFVFY